MFIVVLPLIPLLVGITLITMTYTVITTKIVNSTKVEHL